MSGPHLNWATETASVEEFLDNGNGIFHVRATDESMPSKFLDVVEEVASSAPRHRVTCFVDPRNQLTASPLGALRLILNTAGRVKPFVPPSQNLSLTVASDVRALFGSITIENVHVNASSASEAEQLGALVDLLTDQLEAGRRFDDLLVVFRDCHSMDMPLRRSFFATIWEPALSRMVDHGAKVVFHFEPSGITTDMTSLPPMAHASVTLPTELAGITEELAGIALDLAWEENRHDARVLARAIVDTSPTAFTIYDAMARLALRKFR